MLHTDEAALIGKAAVAVFGVRAGLSAVREAMASSTANDEPVKTWITKTLNQAHIELTVIAAVLDALYYAAPPCDLGEADKRIHDDVAWWRAQLIRVCPDVFTEMERATYGRKPTGYDISLSLSEGMEASGWQALDDLPEGIIAFVPRGEP